MPAVFIAQTTLDEWSDQGKVRLEDTTLTLLQDGRPAQTVKLRPAVRFTRIVDGDDAHKLVGKVKTKEQLAEMGADHSFDSVIHGETAYEVVEGYLGDMAAPPAARPPAAATAPSAAPRSVPAAVALPTGGAAPEASRPPSPLEAAAAAAANAQGPAAAPVASADDAPVGGSDEARQLSELFLNTVR